MNKKKILIDLYNKNKLFVVRLDEDSDPIFTYEIVYLNKGTIDNGNFISLYTFSSKYEYNECEVISKKYRKIFKELKSYNLI